MTKNAKPSSKPNRFAPSSEEDRVSNEKIEGLLSRFGEYVFSPAPPELSESELSAQVQLAMERTRDIRAKTCTKHKPLAARKFSAFRSIVLAMAAGIVAVFGMWRLMTVSDSGTTRPQHERLASNTTGLIASDTLPLASLARGLTFRDGNAKDLDISLIDPAHTPVAYVFRYNADVRLSRIPDAVQSLQTPCVSVSSNDLLIIAGQMPVIIMFYDRFIRIEKPGHYRILSEGTVRREPGGDVLPTADVPGLPLMLPFEQLLGASKLSACSLSSAPPPSASVVVLSPTGDMLSQTPEIRWVGNDADMFEFALIPVLGDSDVAPASHRPAFARGGILKWSDTGWGPLPRGSTWRLALRSKDRNVTESTFRVLPIDKAEALAKHLDYIARILPDGDARLFTQASVLLQTDPACAAEARLLAMQLWQVPESRNNIVYMRLVLQAYVKMGMPEAVRQMRQRIQEALTTDSGDSRNK